MVKLQLKTCNMKYTMWLGIINFSGGRQVVALQDMISVVSQRFGVGVMGVRKPGDGIYCESISRRSRGHSQMRQLEGSVARVSEESEYG